MKKVSEVIKQLQARLENFGDENIFFVMAITDNSHQQEAWKKAFIDFENKIIYGEVVK